MPRTRGERQRRERRKSFSRIKGRKRKISTSSEEDEEPWNTSLAVHETPSGEAEEFLCPYFDGSKLILPPGYEDYKKKVEKDEIKSVTRSSAAKTTDPTGVPLRRSNRGSKSKKPMYIYSDDEESSGFEDSKLSSAIASGTPIPTCMFVNAGVAGGSGIDVNKDIFKTLPQTKGLPVSASQCGDDEKMEFTIEINESSDEDESDGTKPNKIVLLPDDISNINGVNETKSEVTEPDIKVKDDPIFLSDDEVISNESVKNGKDSEQGEDSQSNFGEINSPIQEEALEHKNDPKENDKQKDNDVSGETVTDNSIAMEESKNDSLPVSSTERTTNSDLEDVSTASATECKKPNERLNSTDSGNESSNDNKEVDVNVQNDFERNDTNYECSNTTSKATEEDNLDQGSKGNSTIDLNASALDRGNGDRDIAEDGHALSCENKSNDKENELETNVCVNETIGTSISESKEMAQTDELVNLGGAEEDKSEKADSEKTEELEPEVEHPLMFEIKEKMKEYCSQRVEFTETLDLKGHLLVTADNEKPVRGSIGQSIGREECKAVENPVPTVCVPQELSNLVQKFCKDKLQYSVELLIQGEIHATIDGTMVSTICNFSFEPEEDDF